MKTESVLAIAVVGALAFGAFYLYQQQQKTKMTQVVQAPANSNSSNDPTILDQVSQGVDALGKLGDFIDKNFGSN